MQPVLIAFDLGTTRLKVAAFDPAGRLLAHAGYRHREHQHGPYRWQHADDWWRDAVAGVHAVRAQLPPHRVLGLALSGRGGAAVLVDADGTVRVDPWADLRHAPQQRALLAAAPALAPYTAAMIAKLMWLQAGQPALFRTIRHACYAKDFLLLRLAGAHCTDWSSGPDGPAWPDAVLATAAIDPGLLPRPALPWQAAGGLVPAAARALDLPAGLPVAVGAHDGVAANLGAGALAPGSVAVTLGTHAVVRAIVPRMPEPALAANRFYVMPPDRHVVGGNAWYAGRSAEWFLDLVGDAATDRAATFRRLDEAAMASGPGAGGVRFLPWLDGQVAPQRRPHLRAGWYGFGLASGRGDAWRALIEGVSFAIGEVFTQVERWTGAIDSVCVTGGPAANDLWMRTLAATLDRPLRRTDALVEARGAAMALAVALGHHPDIDAAVRAMCPAGDVVAVDPGLRHALADVRADWCDLRERLAGTPGAPAGGPADAALRA